MPPRGYGILGAIGSLGGGFLGGGGAGTVGICRKCLLRDTVHPVGVGINVICKVSLTLTGSIAVLPKAWDCGASISVRQSCKSAKIGVGGLACLVLFIFDKLLVHWRCTGSMEGGVLPLECGNN